jgi:hypothetical protein
MLQDQDEVDADKDNAHLPPTAKPPKARRGWKKWLATAFASFIVLGVLASLACVYMDVRAGRGGELHRSMWGYKVSPIGILVGMGAAIAVYPAISVIEWRLHWRDRAWERKHPRKPT